MIGEDILHFIAEECPYAGSSMMECMYHGSYNDKSTTNNCSQAPRILIHGPSHSGKTSLTMDVAYSLAAKCKNGITMIKHLSSSSLFPYKCVPNKDMVQGSYQSNYSEVNIDTNSCNQSIEEDGKTLEWNPQILQNINMKYMSSWSELISFLTTAPETEGNGDGFILDDLNQFLSHCYNNNDETMMKLRFVMALTLDIVKDKGTLVLSLDSLPFFPKEKNNRYFLNFYPFLNTIFRIIPKEKTSDLVSDECYEILMQRMDINNNPFTSLSKRQDYSILSGAFEIKILKSTSNINLNYCSDDITSIKNQQDKVIAWNLQKKQVII